MKLFSVLCSNAAKSAYKRPSTRGRGILKRIEEWNFTAFHRLHAFSIEPDIAVSHSTPSHCPHGLRVITTIRSSFVHGRSRIFATFLRWMRHSISRARVLTSRSQKLARIHGILSCERNRNSVGTKRLIPDYFWNRLFAFDRTSCLTSKRYFLNYIFMFHRYNSSLFACSSRKEARFSIITPLLARLYR